MTDSNQSYNVSLLIGQIAYPSNSWEKVNSLRESLHFPIIHLSIPSIPLLLYPSLLRNPAAIPSLPSSLFILPFRLSPLPLFLSLPQSLLQSDHTHTLLWCCRRHTHTLLGCCRTHTHTQKGLSRAQCSHRSKQGVHLTVSQVFMSASGC